MSPRNSSYDPAHFTLYLSDFRGFDWRWNIPVEDYLECKQKRKPVCNDYNYRRFVTPAEPNLVMILDGLVDALPKSEQTPINIAEIIVEFTQHFPYQDKYPDGDDSGGFAKYPLETLCENGGDCVDMSIVAASMLTARGIDSRFLLWSDHLALVINVAAEGEYCYVNQKKFYLANPVGAEFRDDHEKSSIGDKIQDCPLWKAQLLPAYNSIWQKKINS